jgi:transcriptional regulator with XRE-family HTH domain
MKSSKIRTESFGEFIRRLREEKELPLRKVAALLDIDQSTLSKIERNERRANDEMISKLSSIFEVNETDLKVTLLSDKISYDIISSNLNTDVLKVAEEKVNYYKKKLK